MRNKEWPALTGTCRAGSVSCQLADTGRTSHLLSTNQGRAVFTRIWYPADTNTSTATARERLWQDIHQDPGVPGIMKLLLHGTSKIDTHAYSQAPFSTEIKRPDILVYNHGLISFAAENTWLMEDLASHGYIVIGIQHKEQLDEFKALQGAQSATERKYHASKRIRQTVGDEMADLSREYYQAASNSNRIVSARALDTAFAIDNLNTILNYIPGIETCEPRTGAIGLIGLSLGGAVGTEFAKADDRGAFVVNIDGGIYGMLLDLAVTSPYLMLYSHANDGCNAASLSSKHPAGLLCRTVENTKHLNFHEISMIYPALRWLRVIGTADPLATISLRNRYIIEFIRSITISDT